MLYGKLSSLGSEYAHNYLGKRLIDLLVGSLVGVGLEVVVKYLNELLFKLRLGDRVFRCVLSHYS